MTTVDLVAWLGETSLAVSILILLVLIIRKPFAKTFGARAAYLLWLAPAVRLFLPELKIFPAPEAPASEVFSGAFDVVVAPATSVVGAAPSGFDMPALAAAAGVVIWATVAFAWFSLKMEEQSKYRNERLAASAPAGKRIKEMANIISKDFGLRRAPAIHISKTDDCGPCLIGLFRPTIFLPASFETSYERREQQLALAHEIAHIARGDMAATLIALILQAAQWPNPLAHFSMKAFRTDQEAACDAFVLARCAKSGAAASDYASAILKSVRKGAAAPAYGLALAHPVKERLMLLRNPNKSPLRLIAGALGVTVFTSASLAATASYGVADNKVIIDIDRRASDSEDKTKSTRVITIEGDKPLEIYGVEGARKVELKEVNGERVLKIYDQDGNLISEDVYGPDDELPFNELALKGDDGKAKTIQFARIGSGSFLFDDDFDFDVEFDVDVDHDVRLDGEDGVLLLNSIGSRSLRIGRCGEDTDSGVQVFGWSTETDGENADEIHREVICIVDENADPEKRAEALRKAIASMEAGAKRDAERRREIIKKMREDLREAEREAQRN